MKAGKKKNRNTAEKITKFPLGPSGMEDLEDTELDALLEEELKREADELEARLNSDPKLIGVGASDDLFAKIVASLKDQGVWEEDEKAVKAQEDEAGEEDAEKSGKTKDEVQETEAEYENGKSGAGEKIEPEKEATERAKRMEQQSAAAAEKTDRVAEVNTGSPAEKKEEKAAEVKTKKGIEKNIEENTEENTAASADGNTQKIRKIESNEAEEKNTTENVAFSDKERESKSGSEEAYLQLSEADRRAMEYGYQMQQKDAEKKVRRKKRRKIAKRAGITAAALVAVFGVSMTSDANRRYVLEAWNTVMGNLGVRVSTNYTSDNGSDTNDSEENIARQEVKDELGINPIKFGYLPEDWKYLSSDINLDALYAIMFYSNGDKWLNITMKKNIDENVAYYKLDGESQFTETIVNEQNLQMELYATGTGENESYAALFKDEDNVYYCNGVLTYTEMKKILQYLIIIKG